MKQFKVSTDISIFVGNVAGRKNPAIMIGKPDGLTLTVAYCNSIDDGNVLCEALELLAQGMASYRQQLDLIERIINHGHLSFEDIL
jgi:hypothetical protein